MPSLVTIQEKQNKRKPIGEKQKPQTLQTFTATWAVLRYGLIKLLMSDLPLTVNLHP